MPSSSLIQKLDRDYIGPRGAHEHVIGYDREKEQVIFTRSSYPHECMRPSWQFKQFFTREAV